MPERAGILLPMSDLTEFQGRITTPTGWPVLKSLRRAKPFNHLRKVSHSTEGNCGCSIQCVPIRLPTRTPNLFLSSVLISIPHKRPCVCGHGRSSHLREKRNGEGVYSCARLSCLCENYEPLKTENTPAECVIQNKKRNGVKRNTVRIDDQE